MDDLEGKVGDRHSPTPSKYKAGGWRGALCIQHSHCLNYTVRSLFLATHLSQSIHARMAIETLFKPLSLKCGPLLKNHLLLASLTNWQSNQDGTITNDEPAWLGRCAAGGFSMVMTCTAHVQSSGKTFPGQMGIFSDNHLPGLRLVADVIRKQGGPFICTATSRRCTSWGHKRGIPSCTFRPSAIRSSRAIFGGG